MLRRRIIEAKKQKTKILRNEKKFEKFQNFYVVIWKSWFEKTVI